MNDRVAVDLDDVVLDLTGGIRAIVKREHGVELPEFDQWDMNVVLKPILGEPWMKWFRRKDWLWATCEAVEGAIGGLDRLHQQGYYLECVTSKPDWARHAVWSWLSRWRPYFDRVTIVTDSQRKVDMTSAGVLVDDKLENCIGFAEAGRRALLFDRPHNRGQNHRGVERVVGWRGVLGALGPEAC